nr:MAG TPA: hypothetical protein [Bacteriophage sp.]
MTTAFLVTFLYFSICGTISSQDVAASEYQSQMRFITMDLS